MLSERGDPVQQEWGGTAPTPSALKLSFDALSVKLDSLNGKGGEKEAPRSLDPMLWKRRAELVLGPTLRDPEQAVLASRRPAQN